MDNGGFHLLYKCFLNSIDLSGVRQGAEMDNGGLRVRCGDDSRIIRYDIFYNDELVCTVTRVESKDRFFDSSDHRASVCFHTELQDVHFPNVV